MRSTAWHGPAHEWWEMVTGGLQRRPSRLPVTGVDPVIATWNTSCCYELYSLQNSALSEHDYVVINTSFQTRKEVVGTRRAGEGIENDQRV